MRQSVHGVESRVLKGQASKTYLAEANTPVGPFVVGAFKPIAIGPASRHNRHSREVGNPYLHKAGFPSAWKRPRRDSSLAFRPGADRVFDPFRKAVKEFLATVHAVYHGNGNFAE